MRDLQALRGFEWPEIQDSLDAPVFAAGVRERQALVDEATRRVVDLRARAATTGVEWFDLAETWPRLEAEGQRDILRSVIDRVVVSRGRGHVEERVSIIRKGALGPI